jgi:N-acetyl-alpha-D-glucosaminyl L-malate synthase BshA
MKIGIVCYPTYGGSGAIATELGQVLARRDHDVHVVSYSPPFRLRQFRPNLHYHAVEVSSYPLFRYPPYDLALASKVMEVVDSVGLDILHVHYAIPHSISAYLAKQMLPDHPIKVITTLHGTDITIVGTERAYKEITRFGLRQSDGVTAVSEWLQDETARIFGVSKEIRVIPNFVDTERFAPNGSHEFRERFAPEGQRLIVHASNFRPVKRVQDAVRAFAMVREKMPARLVLVGDGPELPRAVELTEKLGIKSDVIFSGQLESIDQLLKVADLFLLPSEFESFGLAALEALSCGTPVVASQSGGLSEVVTHGENGFLVPVGDYREMGQHAISLLTDEAKFQSFRKAARKTAVDRFPEEKIVTMYERYYEEVLSGSSSSS